MKALDRFSFWRNASIKQKRIYSVVFVFIIATLVTFAASFYPLTSQEAQQIYNDTGQIITDNPTFSSLTLAIFLNNYIICLVMFLPLVGFIFGMYVLFNTGIALGGISTVRGWPVWLGEVNLFFTPVFWIEFISYSIAMAASIWLFYRVTQDRYGEVKNTAIMVGIVTGLLALGAVVESLMILS